MAKGELNPQKMSGANSRTLTRNAHLDPDPDAQADPVASSGRAGLSGTALNPRYLPGSGRAWGGP
jgi:hypothetical protein